MTKLRVILLFAWSTALLSGCGHKPTDGTSDFAKQTANGSVLSAERLAQELMVGISRQRVVQLLGEPDSEIVIDDIHRRLDFFYEKPTLSENDSITGVTVFLANGTLLRWSPILGGLETERTAIAPEIAQVSKEKSGERLAPPPLQFWVVSQTFFEGAKHIDSERFPKLGYIGTIPALTITNLSSRASTEIIRGGDKYPDKTNYVLQIEVSRSDSERFAELCRENLGRSVFITVGELEVASQKIRSVIASQNWILPVDDKSRLLNVQQRLKDLTLAKDIK